MDDENSKLCILTHQSGCKESYRFVEEEKEVGGGNII